MNYKFDEEEELTVDPDKDFPKEKD